MIKVLLGLAIVGQFLSVTAYALDDDRGNSFFGGAGLFIGQNVFGVDTAGNAAKSKFLAQGYLAEAGMTMGGRSGFQLSLELGQSSGRNRSSSEQFVEVGDQSYFGAKAGGFYGPLTLGGGYRHNSLEIKSLTLAPSDYSKTVYTGNTPFGFANVTFTVQKQFRAAIEVQYVKGTLQGSGGAGSLNYDEATMSLRFFAVFN